MIDGGAEFPALRLANEGGTHGPVGAYVVTGWPSTYPSRAQNSTGTFQDGLTRREVEERRRLQQAADGLATVATGAPDLLKEFALGPRRLAAGVPLCEQGERLIVVEGETADDAAARLEGVEVAVVP